MSDINQVQVNGVDYDIVDSDVAGKADKVASAVSGNFASLDSNGNLADSGKKAADFVEVEQGKGLSSNDFTTAEKNKLSGIEAGAEVNVIETDAPSDSKQYARKNGAWEEVDAITSVGWNDVTDKPSTFPPSTHTHDDRYYTESEIDTALGGKQSTANLVTSLSSASTDAQYPSAKCVYDLAGNIESLLSALR